MMAHQIENFQGVYLLVNVNPKYKGRTYIGYTVDPNRRIRQHNLGTHAGGAWRTSGRGPWEMVLIIHGFPNEISALRFEWAWQKPKKSRRLRLLPKKSRKESAFQYCFRILTHMLSIGPWYRLPLTVRWLKQEYQLDFEPGSSPPAHMPIAYGPVISIPIQIIKEGQETVSTSASDGEDKKSSAAASCVDLDICEICQESIKLLAESVKCVSPGCTLKCHLLCLAQHFIGKGTAEFIPVEGSCPACLQNILWGDIIKYKKGCYRNLSTVVSDSRVN